MNDDANLSFISKLLTDNIDLKKINILLNTQLVDKNIVVTNSSIVSESQSTEGFDEYAAGSTFTDILLPAFIDFLIMKNDDDIKIFYKIEKQTAITESSISYVDAKEYTQQFKLIIDSYITDILSTITQISTVRHIPNPYSKTSNDKKDEKKTFENYKNMFLHLLRIIITAPLIYKLFSLDKTEFSDVLTTDKKSGKNYDETKQILNDIIFFDITNFLEWVNTNAINYIGTKNISLRDEISEYLNLTTSQINVNNLIYFLESMDIIEKKFNIEVVKDLHLQIVSLIITPFFTERIKDKFNLSKIERDFYSDIIAKEKLSNALNEKLNNSIITFLKIRNDDDVSAHYNTDRFKIFHEKEDSDEILRKLIVYYNDNNMKHQFQNIYGEIMDDDEAKGSEAKYDGNNNDSKRGDSLNNIYLFGEFTRVFLPHESNKDIADKMETITSKLTEENPKPVFMLGYGASGAGKTSSLIYYKNASDPIQKDGVLIHLCNQLGKTGHYNAIDLQYTEFYRKIGTDGKETLIKQPSHQGGSLSFKFETSQFLLENEYTHDIVHPYRLENMKPEYIKTKFDKGTPLGEMIIHLVDTDRFVKATTNNPNSSRSHTLVFVTLKNDSKKTANIIVGDFAGVENTFDCINPDTLNKFLSIKRDDRGSLNNGKLFYSTNSSESEIDPIDINSIQKGGDGFSQEGNQTCAPKMTVEYPVYDFSNPTIRDNFNDSIKNIFIKAGAQPNDFGIIQITEDNMNYLKIYIAFIRNINHVVSARNLRIDTINNMFYSDDQKQMQKESLKKIARVHDYITDFDKAVRELLSRKYIIDYAQKKQELEKNIKILQAEEDEKARKEQEEAVQNAIKMTELEKQKTGIKDQYENAKQLFLNTVNTFKKKPEDASITNYYKAWEKNNNDEKIKIYKSFKYNENEKPFPKPDSWKAMFHLNIQTKDDIKVLALIKPLFNWCLQKYNINTSAIQQTMDNQSTVTGFLNSTFDALDEQANGDMENIEKQIEELKMKTASIKGNTELNNQKLELEKIKTRQKAVGDLVSSIQTDQDNQFEIYTLKDELKQLKPSDVAAEIKKDIGILDENGNTNLLFHLGISNINYNSKINDIISVFKDSTEYSKKNLTDIISIFDELFDTVHDMELEKFCREKGIDIICKNRVVEGNFINDSLFEVRNTIKTILYQKNKGKKISPNFIDICFEQYCPSHKYCFTNKLDYDKIILEEIKRSEENSTTDEEHGQGTSVIFNEIYEKLNSSGKYLTITEMYKEIIVSVFCVFNISRSANNPPPIPYIDINKIKYLFNNKMDIAGEFLKDNQLIRDIKKELQDVSTKITTTYTDKVSDLTNVILKDAPKDFKKKTIMYGIELFIQNIEGTSNQKIKPYQYKNVYVPLLKQFIAMIDKSNAISAIGTLEFLDQLAKFNGVTNICRKDTILNETKVNDYIEDNNMEELYA